MLFLKTSYQKPFFYILKRQPNPKDLKGSSQSASGSSGSTSTSSPTQSSTVPPGMSEYSWRRVMGDEGWKADELEEVDHLLVSSSFHVIVS